MPALGEWRRGVGGARETSVVVAEAIVASGAGVVAVSEVGAGDVVACGTADGSATMGEHSEFTHLLHSEPPQGEGCYSASHRWARVG